MSWLSSLLIPSLGSVTILINHSSWFLFFVHPNVTISYFLLLDPPPSLPQWKIRETEYAAVDSDERRQLMDGSEEEEQEKSTPGTCRTLTHTALIVLIKTNVI